MAIPRGIRNNNPLNIRKGNNWQGERHPQKDEAFEEFESIEYGIRAGFKLLKRYMSGYEGRKKPLDTIDKIVRRWAPETENATMKYIDYVSAFTGIHKDSKIEFRNRDVMCKVVQGMIMVECGQLVDLDIIKSGYDLV